MPGFSINPSKSGVFLSAIPQHLKKQILEILQFKEEYQLVRYLGLPLISRKLTLKECHPLIKFKVESTYGLQRISHFRELQLLNAGSLWVALVHFEPFGGFPV